MSDDYYCQPDETAKLWKDDDTKRCQASLVQREVRGKEIGELLLDAGKRIVRLERELAEAKMNAKVRDDFICPFCRQPDFDLVGLKHHLEHGECEDFDATETFSNPFDAP